ncbi:MAG: hypothetical protein H6695_20015 [Deferribacteres bacterium]|nr:hypothetical protein [candidate division KSB1 bacterium]MCB9512472.1 hypothetical protein [Deferribacteres bacterium]
MSRLILNTLVMLYLFGSTHVVKSQDLQKGQQVRVYLNKQLPGLEDLVKKVPERNLWRTKSKIQFQSYDGDTLRIAVYTSTENTHRAWDPALLKWKLVHTESKFQQNAAIHRDFVDRLEIKTGSKSLVLPGVLIGGMVGIATGAMFVTDEGDWDFSPVYVPFGAAIGFIAGGVIGASMHTEKWQEIPLQQLQSDSMSSR